MTLALLSKTRHVGSTMPTRMHKKKHGAGRSYIGPQLRLDGATPGPLAITALRPPLIQAKLKIGEPNDKYEQEADRVADAVMRMPEATQVNELTRAAQRPGQRIQRLCTECEDELQRQPINEEEQVLQAKSTHSGMPGIGHNLGSRVNQLRGRGQPLPKTLRTFFEPRFGHDFGSVRLHTDGQAANTAGAINARAFTTGRDIVFGTNQFAPETRYGKKLLAHELTHVLQQSSTQEMSTLQRQTAPIEQERSTESNVTIRPDQLRLAIDFLRGSRQFTVEGGLTQPLNLLGVSIRGIPPSSLNFALRLSDRCNRGFQSAALNFEQNQRRSGGLFDLTRNPWRIGASAGFRVGTVRLEPGLTLGFEGSRLDTVLFVLTVVSAVSDDIPRECIVPQRPEQETDEPTITPPIITPPLEPAPELSPVTVNFFYDSTIHRAESNSELRRVISILLRVPRLRAHLVGHASLEGTDQYNLRLGQRRANAIRGLLVLGGVEAGRITTVSTGEFAPTVPEPPVQQRTLIPSIENIRNQNRRVEIIFLDPQGEYAPTSAQLILRTLELRRPDLGTRPTLGTSRLRLDNN